MASFLRSIFSKAICLKSGNVALVSMKRMSGYSDLVVPTNFQKKVLVWTRFYPDAVSVPAKVSRGQLKKAYDLFRIRCNLLMIVFVVGSCAAMIVRGRQLRRDGDTAQKRGLAIIEKLREGKAEGGKS